MGRYIEQTESRSELQQRIAADLRARNEAKSKQEGGPGDLPDGPDGVDDAAYLKGTKVTTSLAPVWAAIFVIAVGIFIYFIYLVNTQ